MESSRLRSSRNCEGSLGHFPAFIQLLSVWEPPTGWERVLAGREASHPAWGCGALAPDHRMTGQQVVAPGFTFVP